MNKPFNCPECEEVIGKIKNRCSCGWKVKKINDESNSVHYDRCAYVDGEKRCSLPGTMSKKLYGVAQWFCKNHVKIFMS